jgi:hypothetical protein
MVVGKMPELHVDKPALFKKLGYEPHSEHQWSIHRSSARYRIPCCGRRFGKSQAAGHEITAYAFTPDSWIWIVGPTYKLGEKEFRVVYDDFVRKLKIKVKKQYNVLQGNMRIELPWNTTIEVVSADKQDSLVGEGLDLACMSEAALHQMSTWQMFIQPALSDKRGDAIFPSTPRGYNWYYGLYQMGQNPNEPLYDSWRFPSWYNVAMYPEGYDDPEMKQIRDSVSETFWEQEYGAEFTTFAGQIYNEFDEALHVKDFDYNPFWRNYQVFDFGFTDPFVCLDIMVDEMENVYVWREYMVKGKTTWEHAHALLNRENPDGYHVSGRFADPRGADEIATLQLVLGAVYARDVGWITGIEAVKRWLKPQENGQPKLFIHRRCSELIRQMKALRAKTAKEGHNVKEGQHDYDDHGPDTLRYFFNEFFVLGANASLEDVYSGTYQGSEAQGFVTWAGGVTLGGDVGYYQGTRT